MKRVILYLRITDERNDSRQKYYTRPHSPDSEPPVLMSLCKEISECSSEWSCQYIPYPKCENSIAPESPSKIWESYQYAKRESTEAESKW